MFKNSILKGGILMKVRTVEVVKPTFGPEEGWG